jgi:hypothetical protein
MLDVEASDYTKTLTRPLAMFLATGQVINESARALITHYKEAKEQGKSSGALR